MVHEALFFYLKAKENLFNMIRSIQPFLTASFMTLALALQIGAQPAKQPAAKETAKKAASAPSKMVDLNQGTQADLESLPGVGPAAARKIVAARPIASVSDLERAGVNKSTIAKITPMVTVGTPAAAPPAAPSAPASAAKSKNTNTPAATQAPGGGNGQVWVNKETKVFHKEGDRWYGKTKKGEYMTEQAAIAAGYRESREGAVKKKK